MIERLIKSVDRVKDLGEVFTPKRVVSFMLRQKEISCKVNDLTATFLEPAAGEGVFLVEILRRKLLAAKRKSANAEEFAENCLIGLSSLYGIELMQDNEDMLVLNMLDRFEKSYSSGLAKWGGAFNHRVIDSAKVIINANMVQGNTLTRMSGDGRPIVFSEWKILENTERHADKKDGSEAFFSPRRVLRVEHTFDSIVKEATAGENSASDDLPDMRFGMSALIMDSELRSEDQRQTIGSLIHQFTPCRILDIYKQDQA